MSTVEKGQSNMLLQFVLTPMKVLKKAREFYMTGCDGCAGKVANGGVIASYGAPVFTKSFSFHSSEKARDKELEEVLGVLASKNLTGRVDRNKKMRHATEKHKRMVRGNHGVQKMKRIVEDETYSFKSESEDLNGGSINSRSRSYAHNRTSNQ